MKNFTWLITFTVFLLPFLSLSQTFTPMGIDDPVIDIDKEITPATTCDPANGAIKVTATIQGNGLSPESVFQWFTGSNSAPSDAFEDGVDGNIVTVDQSTSKIINLKPGQYTLIVRDVTSEGEVVSEPTTYVVTNDAVIPTVTTIATIDQNCNIPGSLEVTGISPGTQEEYTYAWYREGISEDNKIEGATGPLLNYETAGTYYVVATAVASGCSSEPKQAEIGDLSTAPEIAFIQTPNTSCGTGNGTLEATLTPEGNYSFTWYLGSGTSTPFNGTANGSGNKSRIENLNPGTYTLKAINNASGCETTGTFTVENNSGAAEVLTFLSAPQDVCAPSGSLKVTSLSKGSPSDYTYAWYRESIDATGLIPGVTGQVLNATNYADIGAGTYYVVATVSGCSSAPKVAVIEDTSETPVLSFIGDASLGTITAEVTGGATLSFEWFVGPGMSTPFVEGTHGEISGSENASTISNIQSGEYTLKVTDGGSGCITTGTYQLQGETVRPQVVDISSGAGDPTNQSPLTVRVAFSEAMGDTFDLGKAAIENGQAKNLKRVNDNTFSFDITPVSDGEITVTIPAAIALDLEGNSNEASSETFRIVYDGTAPSVTIGSVVSGVTDTSPVPVSIEFSEEVTGFGLEDIATINADISGFKIINTTSYSITLTPVAAGNVTVSVGGGAASDAAGNPNTEGRFQFGFKIADTTKVAFAGPGQAVSQADGTFALEVTLQNPDPVQATTVEVALTGGDSAAIDNYTTQTLRFEGGSNESKFITIRISADYHPGEEEILVFSLQNVTGGHKATTGEDGSFELTIQYDEVTGLDPDIIAGVDIFPNPVAGYLKVHVDRAKSMTAPKVMIYDLYGQQVKAQPLQKDKNHINMSDLKNGVYMVYFFSDEKVMVQKIQVLK